MSQINMHAVVTVLSSLQEPIAQAPFAGAPSSISPSISGTCMHRFGCDSRARHMQWPFFGFKGPSCLHR